MYKKIKFLITAFSIIGLLATLSANMETVDITSYAFMHTNAFNEKNRHTAFSTDAGNTTSFYVDGLPVEVAYTVSDMIVRYPKRGNETSIEIDHIMLAMGSGELEEIGTPDQGIARIPYPEGLDRKTAEDKLWNLIISGEFGY